MAKLQKRYGIALIWRKEVGENAPEISHALIPKPAEPEPIFPEIRGSGFFVTESYHGPDFRKYWFRLCRV